MIGLAQSLADDWATLEADFTRFYGHDLRQLCWGDSPWGCRRLLAHVVALPPDSATVRARMKAPLGWDNATEMQAAAVDSIRHFTSVMVAINSERAGDPLPRVVRPYEDAPVLESISLAAFGALITKE